MIFEIEETRKDAIQCKLDVDLLNSYIKEQGLSILSLLQLLINQIADELAKTNVFNFNKDYLFRWLSHILQADINQNSQEVTRLSSLIDGRFSSCCRK